jgi:hypothetical protein
MSTYEDLGLDLIMNVNKKVKKPADNGTQQSLNRLHKSFQIFQQKALGNRVVAHRIDEFAEYFERNIKTIIADFEKLHYGKGD